MSNPAPPANLLSLPVELRLEIYYYVFPPLTPETHAIPHSTFSQLRTTLNILLTCRLIHSEAQNLFFKSHTFVCTRDLKKQPLPSSPCPHPLTLITTLLFPSHHNHIFPFPGAFEKPGAQIKHSAGIPPYTTASTYCYDFFEVYALARYLPSLRRIIALGVESSRPFCCRRASADVDGVAVLNGRMKRKYAELRELKYSLRETGHGHLDWMLKVRVGERKRRRVVEVVICGLVREGEESAPNLGLWCGKLKFWSARTDLAVCSGLH